MWISQTLKELFSPKIGRHFIGGDFKFRLEDTLFTRLFTRVGQ